MHEIFEIKKYNILVRPVDNITGYTFVFTELKLLQIDLVSYIKNNINISGIIISHRIYNQNINN